MRATRILAFFFVAGVFSSAGAAAQVLVDGRGKEMPAAATPKWGVSDLELATLYAWDFSPLDDRMIFGDVAPGAFRKYCVARRRHT